MKPKSNETQWAVIVGSGDLLGVMDYLSECFQSVYKQLLLLPIYLIAYVWLLCGALFSCCAAQSQPCGVECTQIFRSIFEANCKSGNGQMEIGPNHKSRLAEKMPAIFGGDNQLINQWFQHQLLGRDSRILVALPGQSIIDISSNKSASHASESESDKLWDADPYGLIHDLADVIHYFFVVLVAAIAGFIASRRMTPNNY